MTTPDVASDPSAALARRELVVAAVVMVALTRAVEPADAFLVAGLLPVVMLVAGVGVLNLGAAASRPFEALIVPAVLDGRHRRGDPPRPGGARAGPGPARVRHPARPDPRARAAPPRPARRARPDATAPAVGSPAVVTAFIAFSGVATLVPGGLAAAGRRAAGGTGVTEGWLVVMAVDDALVALLLGYRLALFRYGTVRDAARSAATSAIVVAVTAGAVGRSTSRCSSGRRC